MPPIKLASSLTQLSINCLAKFFEKHLSEADVKLKGVDQSSSNSRRLSRNKDQSEENYDDKNIYKGALINKDEKKPENENSQEYLEIVRSFLVQLAQDITSHSHCRLQEITFWTILTPLNRLYNKPISSEVKKIIRDVVPLFVNTSLRDFNFGSFKMFTEVAMFEEMYSRLSNARHLEKLVFGRSCYWRSKSIQKLNQVLLNIANLQVLHIKYICQPEMLEGLPESCPQIRELSLEGSKDIKNEEVPILARFVNLDTLDISGTAITGKGCRTLVLELPKLTWLTHCPFNCNSDVLIFESRAALFFHIRSQILTHSKIGNEMDNQLYIDPVRIIDADEPKEHMFDKDQQIPAGSASGTEDQLRLNLKNFWLFNSSTEELLLTHLCPDLERLRLDFVMQDLAEVPEMDAIRQLPKLNSVALYTYDSCPVLLVTSVIESAQWLTTLHLHLGDEWFFVAPIVNTIASCCPNLVYLMMEGDYKGHQYSLEEADERLDLSLPPGGLARLKEAKLAGCVSDARLAHLLTQAPNLHVLHLDGELEGLHDDTVTNAIKQNLLLQLRVLWLNVSAGLTLGSVRRLLQSENRLERVGRLCLMAAASKDAYQDLLRLARRRNLATELIWVTDQRELREVPEMNIG